jgi:hypothetical protein
LAGPKGQVSSAILPPLFRGVAFAKAKFLSRKQKEVRLKRDAPNLVGEKTAYAAACEAESRNGPTAIWRNSHSRTQHIVRNRELRHKLWICSIASAADRGRNKKGRGLNSIT